MVWGVCCMGKMVEDGPLIGEVKIPRGGNMWNNFVLARAS